MKKLGTLLLLLSVGLFSFGCAKDEGAAPDAAAPAAENGNGDMADPAAPADDAAPDATT